VDDSNLVFVGEWDKKGDLVDKINYDLNHVVASVNSNDLMLNEEKTKILVFGTTNNLRKYGRLDVKIKDVIIQECESIKCLGLILEGNLKWDKQIESVVRKCFAVIGGIYKIKEYLPIQTRKLIMEALVASLLEYMIVI